MLQSLRFFTYYARISSFTLFPLHISRSIRKVSCWKCGTDNSAELYCRNCSVLQEPDNKTNYFDILGIPLSYNINDQDLVSKYHKMQILFHPDKHTNKSEKEKEISENYSALINKAYTALSNPLQRGLYILKIKGYGIDEEKTSSADRQLFIEILELNDEVQNVSTLSHAKKLTKKLSKMVDDLIKEISQAFKEDNTEKAQTLLNKLKYYMNVVQKLKTKKQKLGFPD